MSELYEMYHAGKLYSMHSGSPYQMEHKKVLMVMYPRDFTPICTQEIRQLNDLQDAFPDDWFVCGASTDSPEVHQEAWANHGDFTLPLVTIESPEKDSYTRAFFKYNYARRATLWLVNDELQQVYMTHDNVARDMEVIVKLTKELDSVVN